MNTIPNKWVEKVKAKKKAETAPAFESKPGDNWSPTGLSKDIKRHTMSAKANLHKTLRGLRK